MSMDRLLQMRDPEYSLEEELVQHPGFRWVDGMLGVSSAQTDYGYFVRETAVVMSRIDGLFPLLNDPSTLGGLMFLARQQISRNLRTEYDAMNDVWCVWQDMRILSYARTEGEALAIAILESDTSNLEN